MHYTGRVPPPSLADPLAPAAYKCNTCTQHHECVLDGGETPSMSGTSFLATPTSRSTARWCLWGGGGRTRCIILAQGQEFRIRYYQTTGQSALRTAHRTCSCCRGLWSERITRFVLACCLTLRICFPGNPSTFEPRCIKGCMVMCALYRPGATT